MPEPTSWPWVPARPGGSIAPTTSCKASTIIPVDIWVWVVTPRASASRWKDQAGLEMVPPATPPLPAALRHELQPYVPTEAAAARRGRRSLQSSRPRTSAGGRAGHPDIHRRQGPHPRRSAGAQDQLRSSLRASTSGVPTIRGARAFDVLNSFTRCRTTSACALRSGGRGRAGPSGVKVLKD